MFGVHLHERVSASCCIGLASGISRCVRVTRRRIGRRSRRIKNFTALVADAIPPEACGKPLELWWQDEARIGQQGSLTYIWAEQGTRLPARPWCCPRPMPKQ